MADFSHEIGADDAVGAGTSTLSPSAQALSRVQPPRNESGLFSGESVLNILKLIFAGSPLPEVLTIIAQLVEAQGKGMFCTIWLLDKEGKYVRCATAPSLPGFIANWDRTPVGPDGACCGTAVYRREPVYATDILNDPLWDSYRHLVVPYGVRAVWARPLFSSAGKALGTFAILYRNVGSPSATDLQLIENASHIVGIAIERHINEEKLRRSEAFLAEAQRLSVTGSFSWQVDTDEITFSEELYRIFEFDYDAPVTVEQIVGRVHPEDIPLLSEKMDLARKNINDHDYAIRLRMPDGRIKYLRTKSYGIRDRDGRLEHVGAIQDATEHRLSEAALAKASSELAHVARVTSLGALTASIAHEVSQPLSGIITNACTCLRMLASDPPNVEGARETVRRTLRDGNRASEVITRLRALFSKKEATIESVDLNEAAREVIALSLSELQRNRVMLRTELAIELPVVKGDRVQLQQVVLNLIRNAWDAMSAVNDRPRHMVIKTEPEEGNRVRLTVQDAGVGLNPQAIDRLFEAFYTTKNDGMGMGLSISRSIIERHHGRLWAAPNDGPGATFSFSIPCAPSSVTSAGRRPRKRVGKDAKPFMRNP